MSLTRITSEWGPIGFDGFCRPEDFAQTLIDDFQGDVGEINEDLQMCFTEVVLLYLKLALPHGCMA